MLLKKSITFALFLLLNSSIFCMEQICSTSASEANQLRPVIMIVESMQTECTRFYKDSLMTQHFCHALLQEKSAILISESILCRIESIPSDAFCDVSCGVSKNFEEIKNNWTVFYCKNAHTFLFIPKLSYSKLITGFNQEQLIPVDINIFEDMKKLRAHVLDSCTHYQWLERLTSLSRVTKYTHDQYLNFYKKCLFRFPATELSELKKIFVKHSGNWLFLKNGHGFYTREMFRNKGGTSRWLQYFDDAVISGLWKKQNMEFLEFVGTELQTFAVIEMTCFGGGYNANEMLQHIKRLEQKPEFKSFIYCAGTTIDSITVHKEDIQNFFAHINTDIIPLRDEFLYALCSFIKHDSLPEITDVFLIYTPGRSSFELLKHKEIEFLGDDNFIDSTFTSDRFIGANKYFIISSSDFVNIHIKVEGEGVRILSLLVGDKFHELEEISAKSSLYDLLEDSFFHIIEANTKSYLIHKIECQGLDVADKESKKPLELENVIIRKSYAAGGVRLVAMIWIKIKDRDACYKIDYSVGFGLWNRLSKMCKKDITLTEISQGEYQKVLASFNTNMALQRAKTPSCK